MSDKVRAKVEVSYGEGKPVVKLFGDIRARDLRMLPVYVRRQFRAMIGENNRRIRKTELEEKKKVQEEAKKQKETANMEGKKDESGTIKIGRAHV